MRYIKAAIWSLIIAYLCFAPSDEFKNVHITIPHFDKIVHFGLFFILGIFLAALMYVKPSRFHKVWLPAAAIVYGGLIEVVQLLYIYQREGDFFDWLADAIGVIVAIWVVSFLPNKLKRVL